jgi:uncharacterized protein
MGATLDALHRLQSTEDRLRSVREQVESKQRAVRFRQRRLSELGQQIAEAHDSTLQARANADRLELDRRTREEHIARLREALNRTKSNKEYAAILTQLNTDKADMLKLEDEILKVLAQADELRNHEAALKVSLTEEQRQAERVTEVLRSAESKLSEELKSLESQRDEAASQIPPSVLSVFERSCERNEGEAMARVEKAHPKRAEYVCSGCSMSVPLEIINALQTRDEVQQCQTCSRILFLEAPAAAPASGRA